MPLGVAKSSPMDLFLVYQFMRRLNSPFHNWRAFKFGVIDAEGKVLIPRDQRTPEQDDSLKMFDMLVLRLKKMLALIPGGSSKLATWAASWMLVKESINEKTSDDDIRQALVESIGNIDPEDIEAFMVMEEAPVNNVSGGNIAGANDDPPLKRKRFGQTEVFTVNTNVFTRARFGKNRYHQYEKYVGDCPTGRAIREYGLSNPKRAIIIEDELTGAMMYLKRGN